MTDNYADGETKRLQHKAEKLIDSWGRVCLLATSNKFSQLMHFAVPRRHLPSVLQS